MSVSFMPIERKMLDEGLPPVAVDTFRHYWEQLQSGSTGLVHETEIEAVGDIPYARDLGNHLAAGRAALDSTVVIKLNGGLGTGMGMSQAKSLLPVKGDRCFLDIVAGQIMALRAGSGARLPLVLMNSYRTREDSLERLGHHPGLGSDLPADFLQHKVPRLRVEDGAALEWPDDPSLEWCPPGHGDLYTALVTSGMLDRIQEAGYRYAFVSNADNLGAVLDPNVLGWFATKGLPFLMEVAERTEADRKGGHLARGADGGLLLRESAQCPDADAASFQDITRHRFFNTNSLWLDLGELARELEANEHVLGLPLIRNEKNAVAGDATTPRVFQLETAMGAAISSFPGAQALCVPRTRFAPVKTTDDLLVVRSDAYELSPAGEMLPTSPPGAQPVVSLDPRWFKLVEDFDARFPAGAPSLRGCRRLTVRGDVHFGRDVVIEGEVELEAEGDERRDVPDGTRLTG